PTASPCVRIAGRGADPLGLCDLASALVEDRSQQRFREHTCPFPRVLPSVIDVFTVPVKAARTCQERDRNLARRFVTRLQHGIRLRASVPTVASPTMAAAHRGGSGGAITGPQ